MAFHTGMSWFIGNPIQAGPGNWNIFSWGGGSQPYCVGTIERTSSGLEAYR